MADISVPEKIAGSNYNFWDFLAIGISKRTTEAMLAKIDFVGNGTFKSAAVKTLGGIALSSMYKPRTNGMIDKIPEYVAAGLVVDGVEDLTVALFGTGNPLDRIMGAGAPATDEVSYF